MLAPVDWLIIICYLVFALAVGFYFSRRAGRNIEQYFVSGRSLPWWLVGTSMVATTFAADTPLAVSGMVFTKGIAGNWYWWVGGFHALLAAIIFAPFWRRARILTDNELVELRYSGKPASALRGFRALYFGVMSNCITIGWVMLAMVKVFKLLFGWNEWGIIWMLFGFTIFYTVLSGLWGVIITDFFQFIFAMGGSVILASICMSEMGGISGLFSRLGGLYSPEKIESITCLIPLRSSMMPLSAFLIYVLLQWWAVGNTDGSGYLSQRLFAAKDERHARLATLWYSIAHFCLRPWPWIIVGLTALVMYPDIADPESGYPKLMLTLLPVGVKGLMIASFLAAFMSTIDTHINWGASYLVNDVYRRFIKPVASERHYVTVSRLFVIFLALLGALISRNLPSIEWAWKYFSSIFAGIGFIYLLRWFWWRINAWTEITVMTVSVVVSNTVYIFTDIQYPYTLLVTLSLSIPISLAVTFMTAPVRREQIEKFRRRVRPEETGRRWKAVLAAYLSSLVCLYSFLFGLGKFILGSTMLGSALLILALCSGFVVSRLLKHC
jgi:SSS family solute:Na+ symporter